MKDLNGRVLAVALALSLTTAGCAQLLDATIDAAANRTGETVGKAIGDYAGRAIVRHYTPMFTNWYTGFVLGLAFQSGGYDVSDKAYAVGDYTRWSLDEEGAGEGKASWLERAYLGDDEDGNQWWKVKFHDGDSGDTTVLEALFTEDRTTLLRLRAQFPQDKAPKEMPVDEQAYYVPPQPLSPQSLEGARVGTETISVPAGRFESQHVRYGSGAGGSLDWWLHDEVPGGLVKYSESYPAADEDEERPEGSEGLDPDNYVLVLTNYGSGAASELGVEMPSRN